jgi:hypothetical protein
VRRAGYASGGQLAALLQPPTRGWFAPPPGDPHPADQGPPLEDIDRLIDRAELAATLEWEADHGGPAWPSWPHSSLFLPRLDDHDQALHEIIVWPHRWFAEHLFELPPLGETPPAWRMLCR